jgi:hypothetical protein
MKVFGPMPEKAERAARAFCPGPITVVYPDGKGSTFGFRVPDHPFVLELLKKFGGPLASTSANLSGRPAALSVEDALASIDGAPDFRVDGGENPRRLQGVDGRCSRRQRRVEESSGPPYKPSAARSRAERLSRKESQPLRVRWFKTPLTEMAGPGFATGQEIMQ